MSSLAAAELARGDVMGMPGAGHQRVGGLAGRVRSAVVRRVFPVARGVYLGVERSPLAFLLRFPPVRSLKSRITYVPAARVLALLDGFAAADVDCWVAGGWGVDALLGRQTRRHYDLDLVIRNRAEDLERARQALADAGFRPGVREFNYGLAMPARHEWRDGTGCTVEVLPVALDKPPFSVVAAGQKPDAPQAGDALEPDGGALFTRGVIGGQAVPCLSARLQFALHKGYDARSIDRADMEALRSHLSQGEGAPPA